MQLPAGVVLSLVALLAVVGCAAATENDPSDVEVGKSYRHELSTHCGISETYFAGRYWITEPELHDGSHNPPPGWDNPTQVGEIRLVSPTEAVFTDDAGHEVVFTPRAHATAFEHVCA